MLDTNIIDSYELRLTCDLAVGCPDWLEEAFSDIADRVGLSSQPGASAEPFGKHRYYYNLPSIYMVYLSILLRLPSIPS